MIKYEVVVEKGISTVWRLNGLRHREDGPAIEDTDGDKSWWLSGRQVTEDSFKTTNNKQ